ncbi:hypothetical protein SAMN05421881_10928, partial [Nitrosomonas halophila]
IFLVMNLLVLVRVFIRLKKFIAKMAIWATKNCMPGKIPFLRFSVSNGLVRETEIFLWAIS